ncbi:MAG: hypothetical protein P8Z79_13575, partial [Sedimentisphaerales bacterium]
MKKKTTSMFVTVATTLVMLGGCAAPSSNHSQTMAETAPPRIEPTGGNESTSPPEEAPTLGENPTLSDYLRVAALNNAGLKAAFEQWKMAVEQVPQAESLPDPRFTYGYFIESVET